MKKKRQLQKLESMLTRTFRVMNGPASLSDSYNAT